jgi:hypothetical protein
MKKIKQIVIAGLFTLLFTGSAVAQSNDGYYTGKATAALNSCIKEARQAGQVVNSSVTHEDESCLNNVTVHFWGTPNCPPNMVCIMIVYPIGSVTFDCHGNIVVVNCGVDAPVEL